MSGPKDLDRWAAWLLERRDGGDPEQRRRTLEYLRPIRDRVLDNAAIRTGDVVLDVGAGDGLIAFGAAERVGPEGRVIFSDVSEDLLEHSKHLAEELGHGNRTRFVQARAEDLAPIEDSSVDVVTARSVLIYVKDKQAAFDSFHRVLHPGGRLSIFEPINGYFPESFEEFWGFDARPVADLVAKIWEHEGWTEHASNDDPMMGFTEKDLLAFAEEIGFGEVHVELQVEVKPGSWVANWEAMLATSPNPNAHTVGEAIRGALTKEEAARVEAHIRPLADAGQGTIRDAHAYLVAIR